MFLVILGYYEVLNTKNILHRPRSGSYMSAHSYYRSDYPCGRSWYRTVKCKNLESYTYRMGSIVSHPAHWTHKGSPGMV